MEMQYGYKGKRKASVFCFNFEESEAHLQYRATALQIDSCEKGFRIPPEALNDVCGTQDYRWWQVLFSKYSSLFPYLMLASDGE